MVKFPVINSGQVAGTTPRGNLMTLDDRLFHFLKGFRVQSLIHWDVKPRNNDIVLLLLHI